MKVEFYVYFDNLQYVPVNCSIVFQNLQGKLKTVTEVLQDPSQSGKGECTGIRNTVDCCNL